MANNEELDEAEQFRLKGVERALIALGEADSPADRLALLREVARLNHGLIDLNSLGISLSGEEHALASRFALDYNGQQLRIDGSKAKLSPEILRTMRFSAESRRVFRQANPDAALLTHSQYPNYRVDTQKAGLRAMLTMPPGAGLMISMPTGTGKSLFFQIAPHYWSTEGKGCIVVIVPTVALALDHERTLRSIPGLERCSAITGLVDQDQRSELIQAFRRGEIPILLLSPELALSPTVSEALCDAAAPPGSKPKGLDAHLKALFVDEAHIIESWGRSFRPDFQRLPALVKRITVNNPDLRTVLLSATVSRAARKLLKQQYGNEHGWLEIDSASPRYEFDLCHQSFVDPGERDETLFRLVDLVPRPAIVYTTRVDDAAQIYARLKQAGYRRLALFTGAVSDTNTRQDIIHNWVKDKIDLVVATSAFGLGINKSNVRSIIHADLPENANRYYQEIGRAGRDGHQATAICLWTKPCTNSQGERKDDETQAAGMAANSWLSIDKARLRWSSMRQAAQRSHGISLQEDQWLGKFDIDAMHEELPGDTSDYNRRWNMSLLNFFQRMRAVEILEAGEKEDRGEIWKTEIIDHRLLATDERLAEFWRDAEEFRGKERKKALQEFRRFQKAISGKEEGCRLANIYNLVDPHAFSRDCGRCDWCIQHDYSPPSDIKLGGGESVWPDRSVDQPHFFETGRFLIEWQGEKKPGRLAEAAALMGRFGFEQIVIPDHAMNAVAHSLVGKSKLGVVVGWSDWLENRWRLANLPTAAWFPDTVQQIDRAWQLIEQFSASYRGQTLVLFAEPGAKVGDRMLEAIASKFAPFSLEALSNWLAERVA